MLAAVSVLSIVIGVVVVWAIAENAGRFEGMLIGVVATIVGLLLASLIVESGWRRRGRTREPHER